MVLFDSKWYGTLYYNYNPARQESTLLEQKSV